MRAIIATFAGALIESDADRRFNVQIYNSSNAKVEDSTFDFNRDSERFIRKVFNTDATATNNDIRKDGVTLKTYWLGETFESNVRNGENSKLETGGATTADTAKLHGVILGLGNGGNGSPVLIYGGEAKGRANADAGGDVQIYGGDSSAGRGGARAAFGPLARRHRPRRAAPTRDRRAPARR